MQRERLKPALTRRAAADNVPETMMLGGSTMKPRQYLALLVLTGAAVTAGAQSPEEGLADCAGVADQQLRLACFDKLAARYAPGPGVAVDTEPREQFGLEHKAPEPVAELAARVTGIDKNALGKMVFTLDNGQAWQQKDSKRLVVQTGDEVRIERGALSAFYLSAGGNRRIQVARVR